MYSHWHSPFAENDLKRTEVADKKLMRRDR
jgi:hypothetical protein